MFGMRAILLAFKKAVFTAAAKMRKVFWKIKFFNEVASTKRLHKQFLYVVCAALNFCPCKNNNVQM